MKKTLSIVLVLSVITGATSVLAVVPDLIPVQGVVTNTGSGTPLDGLTDMRFDIYDAETSGTLLWESVYDSSTSQVDVDQGHFVVYLGELTAHPLDFADLLAASELWLQMSVDGEAMDRLRIASVPFSQEAQYCGQVGDLEEVDIQPALGPPCDTGSFLRGWDADAGTPICDTDQTGTPIGYDYYNVSGADVVHERADAQYMRVSNYGEVYREAGASYTNVYAPVHLPQDATITRLRAWVLDNNSYTGSGQVANVYVRLYRKTVATGVLNPGATSSHNPGILSMATCDTTTGSESADIRMLEDTSISYAQIDNELYDYYFIITLGATVSEVADMAFYKAQIQYTHP